MTDDLGLFTDTSSDDAGSGGGDDAPSRRRGGKRRRLTTIAFVVAGLLIIGGGGWYAMSLFGGLGGYEDYEGSGEQDVVVKVEQGDLLAKIGSRLNQQGVVASVKAFTRAADKNSKASAVQAGYYVLKTKMSGEAAVARLVDPKSRVGSFEVRGGQQLDDTTDNAGKIYEGIFTKISKASCATLNGKDTCVPADQLKATAEQTDPSALGVPSWAVPNVARAEPRRRLEGLIVPGTYDVRPGSDAEELLREVLRSSALRLQAAGMPDNTADTGFSPYEILVMASLIEREAITKDFGKISRVIYNRLAVNHKLEFDSTVNYLLYKQHITTDGNARSDPSPYNTYVSKGLPPTPISAPSKQAIEAAVKPEAGKWFYFVACEKDGTSCFSETYPEQQENERRARANGVY
ncbi:UPF0755 protein [Streptoalloteichus tenebrarius]|uniref:Endolytic murein transglycosylase n=1 Tax=Streptoalloteichus tenebrarius (strain ATCC 17920 / DSM 40477 / JCM 4838 / CBS 697.72 / NBRC 16177 / NCIMB 11028 / NRRL B-12390 / A12253. 1 / ISP 5477) TaxID=1933 RepID=A0ABT1HSD9_STRSD|nr:endolytic transglycosylase MltG [Streptoalloteichus tenebrarius]MCP2258421.1 UPF0755 protein [Streptoalloteichus tenebrarius]BFF03591.1 hypothetical protein GCM10020241_52660 [Streptoalloteichus tenebrarius]